MIIMCIFLEDVFRKTDEEYFFRQEILPGNQADPD